MNSDEPSPHGATPEELNPSATTSLGGETAPNDPMSPTNSVNDSANAAADAEPPGDAKPSVDVETSNDIETSDDNRQTRPSESRSEQETPRKKRRAARILLAGLLVAVLFAPQLGTWLGKGWFVRRLSAETQMDLKIDSLSASWWGGIKIRGVDVKTPSGTRVAQLKELRTQKTAWGLMTAGIEKGKIFIVEPHVMVDLSPETIVELNAAAAKIDVRKGLLKRILQPDRDKKINFVVVNGWGEIKPRGVAEFQTIVRDASPSLHLTRDAGQVSLAIDPGEICQFEVSPTLCDLGLEYILPVLAGAVDADGVCHLRLHSCDLDLQNFAATEVSGELFVDSIRAEVEGPLVGQISSLVAQAVNQGEGPLTLQLTENCPVEFAIADQVVHHEGLKFGLPRVLPSLVLQTRGAIAFDQTMDLRLEAVLPFEDMGEGQVLQKLGSPALSVPIVGTLSAPKVEVGEGQVVKGLVRDVVKSLTDDQVDPAPILDQIGELGLLKKFRERRAGKPSTEDAPLDSSIESSNPALLTPEDTGEGDGEDRPRLLQRIRERGGLLRRRNRE